LDEIRRAQREAQLKRRRFGLDQDQHEIEAQAREVARNRFLTHCRPATVKDYAAWLAAYLDSGGTISHSYDYAMPDRFFVLTRKPDAIPTLYGSQSVQVIVPEGVLSLLDVPNTFHGGCGHSTFYFQTRPPVVVGLSVPLYADVADMITREVSR
jgi:hypothetical protein